MGIYSRWIVPRIIDRVMRFGPLAVQRTRALAEAHGDVLEIGFGGGLNIPHYPPAVRQLTAIDPMDALKRRVAARVAAAPMPVEILHVDAAALPLDSGRFDCVISTWTLCSVDNVAAALAEIRRVLRPDGRYLFLEHGRAEDAGVARWQDRLNGLQRFLAGGCNLNRPIDRLILDAGLKIARLKRFDLQPAPSVLAPHYLGAATRLPLPEGEG